MLHIAGVEQTSGGVEDLIGMGDSRRGGGEG